MSDVFDAAKRGDVEALRRMTGNINDEDEV
jgi:hypothetical protein